MAGRDGSSNLAAALADWEREDAARALDPADHAAIRATESVRSLVLDLFVVGHSRDLFNACARLGALLAEAGASPTLASGVVDGALRVLGDRGLPSDPSRVPAARASLLEGYVATLRDLERSAARSSWAYPACVVPLEEGAVAIACGHPTADREQLVDWAARLATELVKQRARRAYLSGPADAREEVASALGLVGIEVTAPRHASDEAAGERPTRPGGWLRSWWRK